MTVVVNGEACLLKSAGTIAEMVAEVGLIPQLLLIEHNGRALRRDEWAAAELSENDSIEILRVSAGG